MIIVIEGPDNSGKSTLARTLSEQTGIPIQEGSGPPKTKEEFKDRVSRYLNIKPPIIFDRHPLVSEPIYGGIIRNDPLNWVDREDLIAFYNREPRFVYCDPGGRHLIGHQVKEDEEPEHVQGVVDFYFPILEAYRRWAIEHAHHIYRIGYPIPRVTSHFEDIKNFHRKFQLSYDGRPRMLPTDLAIFRSRLLREELEEYNESLLMVDAADALVDLAYVAIGTAYLHGFDFDKAWAMVHSANMKKVRALKASDSKRGSTYDVVKPEGWVPPDLSKVIV